MRKLMRIVCISSLILFFNTKSGGQNNINNYKPFTLIENDRVKNNYRETVKRAYYYLVDYRSLRNILKENREEISIDIPVGTQQLKFNLHQVTLQSNSYSLATEKGLEKYRRSGYKFFRGSALGEPETKIGLTLSDKEVHIMIYIDAGTFQISTLDDADLYYGVYSTDELLQKSFTCDTDTGTDKLQIMQKRNIINTRNALECVEIYLEIDNKSFTENGGTLNSVELWALALMNQVALFYEESNIPLLVSGIKMYTSQDPYYLHDNTSDALSAFRDSMNNQGYNGNLAHLLVGRNIGGGRAYLNVLCSPSFGFGVSGDLESGGVNYSNYSWNINVIAHEIGHNFGSPHTHDCAWNGDNTQIDDCGNIYWINQNEPQYVGSCYDGENQILPGNQGTIMSYCHATGNGQSINLNNGFHPLVKDKIYTNYMLASCGGQQECAGVPPGNDECLDAIPLPVGNGCNPGIYDVEYATSDPILSNLSCGETNSDKDVWYSVVVPETGNLTIETTPALNGLDDMIIEAYSGTCEELTFYACNDDSGDGLHAQLIISDLNLGGKIIYIRVAEKSGLNGFFGICAYSSDIPCRDEVGVLMEFYNATSGSNWTINTGWSIGSNGSDCNYCDWFGITCDPNSDIISIDLADNNLVGTLPATLSMLPTLMTLRLPNNDLSGSIPDIFSSMSNLKKIELNDNNFTGILPNSIAAITALEDVWLSNNSLTGRLPDFTNTRGIQSLFLQNNQFTNCFPFNYYQLCANPNVDLTNNPGLPFSGNLANFCSTWTGTDFDGDGYCYNLNDCNDNNPDVNPGMDEICDGLDNNCDFDIDEGLDHGPNIWVGGSANSYLNSASWSMGHIPKGCEDIEIGMNNETVQIDLDLQQQEIELKMRSIQLGTNVSLHFGQSTYPNIMGGSIINHGTLTFEGGFYMNWLYGFVQYNIQNYGTMNFGINTYNQINANGTAAIKNHLGGEINSTGNIYIQIYQGTYGEGGIINNGLLINQGFISITGSPNGPAIKLGTNGVWHNKGPNSGLDLGGEIEGEGRNR